MEYLPEGIYHCILSFLTGQEAARTTLVSKSWRSAWLTRPDLDFDEQDNSGTVEFLDVVTKCMKRYVQSNLNIQSFSLTMSSCSRKASALSANEFIVKALEIGATRLALRMTDRNREFVIPDEVFASENLVKLSVEGCKIRDDGCRPSSVRCLRLETLTLDRVAVNNDAIAHIISHCRLIEKLVLSDGAWCREEHTGGVSEMPLLRSLVLSQAKFCQLFSGDVSSSKLPLLEDLTVLEYCSHRTVKISNHSLRKLNFNARGQSLKAEFDIPSMRKFTYRGNVDSSLSFKSIPREGWEARVHIECRSLEMSWFRELNKLLTGLSLLSSKIYLFLDANHVWQSFDYDAEDIRDLPKPQVENLAIDVLRWVPSLNVYALFDGLFWICSPKLFTQYLVPESSHDFSWKTNNDFLCKALVREACGKQKRAIETSYMCGLDDLEEVSLRSWDEDDDEWHEVVPLEALLDAPSPTKKQKIQFRMGWTRVPLEDMLDASTPTKKQKIQF